MRTPLSAAMLSCSLLLAVPAVSFNAAEAATQSAARKGTVTSVRATTVKGSGSGVGVVAGAVAGGLLGNQVGKGTGNTIATVGGAVAGGYAGNEVEKHVKKRTVYKTQIKFADGSAKTYTLDERYAVGAKVTVQGLQVRAAP